MNSTGKSGKNRKYKHTHKMMEGDIMTLECIKRFFEDVEFEKWRAEIQNEVLINGLAGNEWKLKQIDRSAANRFGLYFPLNLTDEEYALLFCKCLLQRRSPWIKQEAIEGAENYLKELGEEVPAKVVTFREWLRNQA